MHWIVWKMLGGFVFEIHLMIRVSDILTYILNATLKTVEILELHIALKGLIIASMLIES